MQWTIVAHSDINESQNNYAEWKNPAPILYGKKKKEHTLYDFSYIKL